MLQDKLEDFSRITLPLQMIFCSNCDVWFLFALWSFTSQSLVYSVLGQRHLTTVKREQNRSNTIIIIYYDLTCYSFLRILFLFDTDAADKETLIIAITVSVIVGVCLVGSCLLWKHVRKRSRCVRNREETGSEPSNSENTSKGKTLDDKEAACVTGTNAGPHRVTLNNQTPANIIINFIPTKDSTAKVNTLKEQNLSSCNKTAEKELVR